MARSYKGPVIAALLLMASPCVWAGLSSLEQIEVATFEKMREVERYQLKVAEKHYTNGDFKEALSEYEKFLTLYPRSPGAPYAQLMWSHCQAHLKKQVTALREGFQSVIDYWPESKEATIAAFCIADAYRNMGEVVAATKAFRYVIEKYPDTDLAVRSQIHLLEYARLHKDQKLVINILRELTYDWKRTEITGNTCVQASRELAMIHFRHQHFDEGRKALETSYSDEELDKIVFDFTVQTVQHLIKQEETRPDAVRLADQLIAQLRSNALENPKKAKHHLYGACSINAMLGRDGEIIKTYLEIGAKYGRDDDLLGRMAQWYLDHNDREKAVQLYHQYENVVAGQQAYASLLTKEGKFDEAIAVYSKLIDLNGDNAKEYQSAIASCYESLKQWRNAIHMYRQIDGFPGTYFSMAKCHRKLFEQEEAIKLYEQCKVIDKVAARASLEIGFTYEEAKQRENAIRTFQLTCKRYPKSQSASRAHSHLQNEYNIHVTLGGAEDE